jgi:hypothetical protein
MARFTSRKVSIVQEWDRWIASQRRSRDRATFREALEFFLELQNTRSHLLDFNPRGRDKWEIVHGWLVSAGRVSDSEPPNR